MYCSAIRGGVAVCVHGVHVIDVHEDSLALIHSLISAESQLVYISVILNRVASRLRNK